MYQSFIPFLLVFILVYFVSSGNLTSFKSAFAIPTDQTTVVLSTWGITNNSANIASVVSDFAGNVYLIESNASKVGRLVPATNTFTEWSITSHPLASENIFELPTNPGKLTGIALDPTSGDVYLGESNPNKIDAIDPATNTFTQWALPTHSGKLTGIALDPTSGDVYFGESNPNKIGRLVPRTNTFTQWALPNNSGTIGFNSIAFHPTSGNVYFGESNPNKIGRLVPRTNTFTEWALPTNSGSIFSITPGFAGIYLAEDYSNKIGAFDPATNTFTQWALPTHSGKLTGIALDPTSGDVYFGESNPNKIGRLVPATNTFTEWPIATYSHPLAISATPGGDIFFADNIGRLGRFG
jgi:streptogramin lyase